MQHSLVFIWAQAAPNSLDPFLQRLTSNRATGVKTINNIIQSFCAMSGHMPSWRKGNSLFVSLVYYG
jgi:hypothetical protein